MAKQSIAAIVLAAGAGSRMLSERPKVLHEVAGRPMVLWALDALKGFKLDDAVVVAGHGMDDVQAAVAPRKVVYQPVGLGTGYAANVGFEGLGDFEGDVLIVYGDTPFLEASTLTSMLETLKQQTKSGVVVLGFRPTYMNTYGRLVLGDDGFVSRIVEYQDATENERQIPVCNSGVMAASATCLRQLLPKIDKENAKGEYYLTDLIALAVEAGYSTNYVEANTTEVMGINDREELTRAQEVAQDKLRQKHYENGVTFLDPKSVFLTHDTMIGADTVVEPQVYFGPNVKIGKGVKVRAFSYLEETTVHDAAIIGPFARLRPGTEVGENARVGNFVEIKNAVLGEGAKVNHLTYLGDANVGARANIGAGTITCNYNGFKKFQTRIGASAFIGSNTTLVAPVNVGDGAYVGAGSVITKDVSADDMAVARAKQSKIERGAVRYKDRQKKNA